MAAQIVNVRAEYWPEDKLWAIDFHEADQWCGGTFWLSHSGWSELKAALLMNGIQIEEVTDGSSS